MLFADGDASRIADALSQDGATVVVERDATTAAGPREPSIDCVVSHTTGERPLDDIAAASAALPGVPLVALTADDGPTPAAVLEAGATDCVQMRGAVDDWAPLLARRVDAAVDAAETEMRSAYQSALDFAVGDRPAIVALFDADRRHAAVVGGWEDGGVDPADLEGSRVDDAPFDPAVTAHLQALYEAALGGERRSTTLAVENRLCEVETMPAEGTDEYGKVRYRPAGSATVFDAGDGAALLGEVDGGIDEKVERLHDVASVLEATDRESEIYEIAIESANNVLEFDACVVAEPVDGEFVPLAATADRPQSLNERLGVDEGVIGRTYREGRTVLVEDVRKASEAAPTDSRFRSALSIPVGDIGVFQAVSDEPGAYTESDRELAELLVAHVTHAVERVRYEQTVTRERDRFAALFQNIPDAAIQYVFADGEPRIERVNSAFVRLFGYEPDDAVGESALDLLVRNDDRDEARELYASIRNGEHLDREVERLTVDGPAPFLLRSVPVSSGDDRQRGYIIYTDIGELVERERELERQNDRLDAFASVVSHDLRNPLSSASGYLELARETGNDEHLAVVEEEHERMSRMIEDILTLAREGEAVGEVDPVDLAAVAEASWESADTADATVSIGDLPTVEGDAERLQQLFENLFRNAAFHGGDDVSVRVGAFEDGFYVADDGPGVPDDMKDEVTEMGVSTAKDRGGTGFGLAIVSEIAAGHGWTVEVADAADGGARFEVYTDANGGKAT